MTTGSGVGNAGMGVGSGVGVIVGTCVGSTVGVYVAMRGRVEVELITTPCPPPHDKVSAVRSKQALTNILRPGP